MNLNFIWTLPQLYYDSSAWRGTLEFDGGAFVNQASHYVDLLDLHHQPAHAQYGCSEDYPLNHLAGEQVISLPRPVPTAAAERDPVVACLLSVMVSSTR